MALYGKIAVVTGAAMGIGRAITEILLQNGCKVALLDMNEAAGNDLMEVLEKLYGEERTLFLQCNVESEEQIKAALQKTVDTFGGIDILCNNAGILNELTWEKMVSINLIGAIRVAYLTLEHMSKLNGGQGGVIINTASIAGIEPIASSPVYTAAKHGVVGFTRAMATASTALEYGVRFNAICPSFVETSLLIGIGDRLGQFSELDKSPLERIRLLDVSEVAEAVLEMVTDGTKNGEALMVFSDGKEYATFPSFI